MKRLILAGALLLGGCFVESTSHRSGCPEGAMQCSSDDTVDECVNGRWLVYDDCWDLCNGPGFCDYDDYGPVCFCD